MPAESARHTRSESASAVGLTPAVRTIVNVRRDTDRMGGFRLPDRVVARAIARVVYTSRPRHVQPRGQGRGEGPRAPEARHLHTARSADRLGALADAACGVTGTRRLGEPAGLARGRLCGLA